MQLPFIPSELPVVLIIILLVFVLLIRDIQRRGPDMAYSAGRDPAHQNTRLQQIFIPMEPHEKEQMRAFHLHELSLKEMRAPNYPQDLDGFWAVSGTRQIYFGTQPSFSFDAGALPAFPLANLTDVAERLTKAGYAVI